jgi:biotin carboxyl carrier protein
MNQKEIKELIEFLIDKDIAEFELERGDVKLRVKRAGTQAVPQVVAVAAPLPIAAAPAVSVPAPLLMPRRPALPRRLHLPLRPPRVKTNPLGRL